ncbi:hypothetical protein [Ectopseudomonas guguanensis]|nr:hypothetical protein [Pseudomonas guguanensis]MDR8015998.1 hypothetical protein [Pseudomonas guguanensis]
MIQQTRAFDTSSTPAESQKAKSPENFSAFRALGIAKVAVKKRFELLKH